MIAVIYKIPFIRVSNNGVSAIYNEYGILQQSTKLNTSGLIYVPNLPKKNL
jgi:apolipoprotein N-acyltransferase